MSCFVVSESHVSALLTWANNNAFGGTRMYRDELDKAGRQLLDDNMRAYLHAYKHRDDCGEFEASDYRYREAKKPLTTVEFLKAATCARYQLAEGEGWEKTQGAQMLEGWISRAISLLPGYNDAAWSI